MKVIDHVTANRVLVADSAQSAVETIFSQVLVWCLAVLKENIALYSVIVLSTTAKMFGIEESKLTCIVINTLSVHHLLYLRPCLQRRLHRSHLDVQLARPLSRVQQIGWEALQTHQVRIQHLIFVSEVMVWSLWWK